MQIESVHFDILFDISRACLTSLCSQRFDQVSISSLSLKGIKDKGYEKMTVVQEATLPVILKGLFLMNRVN